MSTLRILQEAALELEAAAQYIEDQRPGHGGRFVAAYQDKLAQIARFPTSGAPITEVAARCELRSFWIRKFGYSIIVGIFDSAPTIIAVMHHSREPGYWLGRLQDTTKPANNEP